MSLQVITEFLQNNIIWFRTISWIILTIGLIQNIIYAIQLPAAWFNLHRNSKQKDSESIWQTLVSDVTLPISIIIPAFNEEKTIVDNVRSMLALKYTHIEIIVVNDGSKDNTLQELINAFSLEPVTRAHELVLEHAKIRGLYGSKESKKLLVIDKENGKCKADASNAGINFSRSPLFCIVDADSLLEGNALLHSILPFMEDPDMVAAGGTIRIVNGCHIKSGQVKEIKLPKNIWALFQSMEYIRAFLIGRLAWSHWHMLNIISGAFGIFRRDIAIEVGGFERSTVGEDYELIVRIHRYMKDNNRKYSMRYMPEPVCWTEAPEDIKSLKNQRKRWQRGALEVLFKHFNMFLNPKYGKIGFLLFPYSFIIDFLGPIAELLGYILIPIFWLLGALNTDFIIAYTALIFLFGIFLSTFALSLEEMELRRTRYTGDLVILYCVAIIENFGYRQLNSFWRVVGLIEFLRKKEGWNTIKRKGFSNK